MILPFCDPLTVTDCDLNNTGSESSSLYILIMHCSAQWAVTCCKDLVCYTVINVQGTSSISWSRSEVAQRQTRYSCLKELFSGKAGYWEHTAASAAAFSAWLSFINCFTLISRRTGPSCIRNVATTTKRIAEYLLWIENHLWKDRQTTISMEPCLIHCFFFLWTWLPYQKHNDVKHHFSPK